MSAKGPKSKEPQIGDEVLVERLFTKSKFDSKFETEIHVIAGLNGPVVRVHTPTKMTEYHKNQVERYSQPPMDGEVSQPIQGAPVSRGTESSTT